MYNLNNLMRNVLITPQEVLFHAQTKHTMDIRMIEQNIIIAEERFIVKELGFDFYDTLVNAKNVVVTDSNLADLQTKIGTGITLKTGMVVNAFEQLSTNQQLLWKQHLWKLTAECVMIISFPEAFIQMSSEGAFHTVPPAGLMVTSGLVTPDLSSIKWSLDKKIQDRVSPLALSMHNWLCKYKTQYGFSQYTKTCDCDAENDENQLKQSNLILSIYDDED